MESTDGGGKHLDQPDPAFPRWRGDCAGHRCGQGRIWPRDDLPAHLADRPLQLPLRLLHAGAGDEVPAARTSISPTTSSSALSGFSRGSGFTKVRLTGGEPTIRPHLVDLVRGIKSFPGIEEVSMTTNALLLGRMADDLADAGLDRVNVCIDTLDPDRFKAMTRGGRLDLVWQGIEAADAAGMRPIKLNTVVVKDQNDLEVGDMAALTHRPALAGALPGDHADGGRRRRPRRRAGHLGGDPGATGSPLRTPGTGRDRRRRPGPSLENPGSGRHDRVHLAGLRAILRRLQPRAADRGRQAAALPAASGRGRPARRHARRSRPTKTLERAIRAAIWRKPWGHGLAEGERETVRGMSQIGG